MQSRRIGEERATYTPVSELCNGAVDEYRGSANFTTISSGKSAVLDYSEHPIDGAVPLCLRRTDNCEAINNGLVLPCHGVGSLAGSIDNSRVADPVALISCSLDTRESAVDRPIRDQLNGFQVSSLGNPHLVQRFSGVECSLNGLKRALPR